MKKETSPKKAAIDIKKMLLYFYYKKGAGPKPPPFSLFLKKNMIKKMAVLLAVQVEY